MFVIPQIAFPVLWDIWRPEERGKSFAISGVAPVLGPAIGPCLGAVVAQATSWRWIFWGASILNACIVGSAIILFPETSAASILGKKARKLRVQTGHPYHTAYDNAAEEKFSKKMWNSMSRPVKLLITQPILLLVSIFMAYGFGVLYIVLATFSSLYTEHYHQTTLQSGLHYLALAVGYTIAEQVGAILMDHFYDRLKAKNGNSVSPEYRVPLMVPGGLLMPIGLLWVSLKL